MPPLLDHLIIENPQFDRIMRPFDVLITPSAHTLMVLLAHSYGQYESSAEHDKPALKLTKL
jgi:hypothetical protein